ncbi:YheC/YheD family protein [Bacillus sp. H-16]|uniref:YheC/YheD family endospore coat-associated protein n=1 Tax=Alteribacter salitolerans TaxID=2912333 RepID=UPI001963CA31|nr:YheC/YheD family protein [Alteribacter salitolerans]MBM7095068.1 YheC/YheD family protein [Alteribacter salitolerans]
METYCFGVMVTKNVLNRMVAEQNAIERDHDLIAASKKVGIDIYFFSPESIDHEAGTVTGTCYDHEKKCWIQKKGIQFPKVLYRRVAGAIIQRDSKLEELLKQHKVHIINRASGFNKWSVHKKLNFSPDIRPFLPETILFNKSSDVKKMLDKYNRVYLKGVQGGRGRQVMMIESTGGGYEYSVFKKELVKERVKSFSLLMKKIRNFYRKQKVIIQEPINLLTFKERLVDIRVEVQKDGMNRVNAVSPCVRLGNSNAPITTHATSYPLVTFLKEKLKFSEKEIKRLTSEIDNLVKTVINELEKHDGPCGEVGIDLGVDKNKKLWFIESNSRSLKVSLVKAYGRKKLQEAYEMILEYAKFVCSNMEKQRAEETGEVQPANESLKEGNKKERRKKKKKKKVKKDQDNRRRKKVAEDENERMTEEAPGEADLVEAVEASEKKVQKGSKGKKSERHEKALEEAPGEADLVEAVEALEKKVQKGSKGKKSERHGKDLEEASVQTDLVEAVEASEKKVQKGSKGKKSERHEKDLEEVPVETDLVEAVEASEKKVQKGSKGKKSERHEKDLEEAPVETDLVEAVKASEKKVQKGSKGKKSKRLKREKLKEQKDVEAVQEEAGVEETAAKEDESVQSESESTKRTVEQDNVVSFEAVKEQKAERGAIKGRRRKNRVKKQEESVKHSEKLAMIREQQKEMLKSRKENQKKRITSKDLLVMRMKVVNGYRWADN